MVLYVSNHKYALSTRYTYGQFVQGKAQIRVCRKFFALLNCAKDNNEICEQFIVQVKTMTFTTKKVLTHSIIISFFDLIIKRA
jgi:hypothetical protein